MRKLILFFLLFELRKWCEAVMDTPEESRRMVFKSGMFIGSNGWIPWGGQFSPISTEGDRLLWKNAQKNEKKNKISEVMKSIIPIFSPLIIVE
jgi:hypothetical protein